MKVGNIKLMTGAVIANLRGEQLASDPSLASLVAAQEAVMWYNTTDKVYKYFNGSSIIALNGGGEAPDLSGLVKADGSVAMTAALELSSDDQSAADSKAAVSKGHVDTQLAKKLTVASGALTADLSAGGFGISNLAAPVNGTDAARKIDIENALAGMNWQEDVDGVQTDATMQPEKVSGKRYVLTDVANLHADFGTIASVANNTIVQYKDSAFVIVFDPAADRADGAIAWNHATKQYVRYNGTSWSVFGGMASVTNGAGLNLNGNELSVKVDAAGGVSVGADGVSLKLNGASLALSADGVKVADGGVGFAQLASAAFGTGLKRNTTSSAIELDTTAVKAAGFIDADGGEVASLILTGDVQEVDGAVATRKFVLDNASGNGSQAYVLDMTGNDVTAETSYTFAHNAGIRFGTVTVYDADGKQIMPSEVTLTDENNLTIDLPEAMKVVIVFVTGANKYVAPETGGNGGGTAPVEPDYELFYGLNQQDSTASITFLLVAKDPSTVKSVDWSGADVNAQFGNWKNPTIKSFVITAYKTSGSPTLPAAGTVTATITKQDSSTEVVTLNYNLPDLTPMLTAGRRDDTSYSASMKVVQTWVKPGETHGVSLCDPSGNVLHTTAGLAANKFAADETISKVEWNVVHNTQNRDKVDTSKVTIAPSFDGLRANVILDSSVAVVSLGGNNYTFAVSAKVTMSSGRVFVAYIGMGILDSTSAVNTKKAPFTQAQLDSAW